MERGQACSHQPLCPEDIASSTLRLDSTRVPRAGGFHSQLSGHLCVKIVGYWIESARSQARIDGFLREPVARCGENQNLQGLHAIRT